MTKLVNGQTTVEYKYDLLGRRACKRVNGGAWWWYFYDGLKVLFEGSDTSSNRGYYTVTPAAVGGIVSRVTPGVRRSYHYDRLGNVMAITDVNGKPYAEYTMDAFGNVLQKGTSTGYSSEFATDPQPYHLTTKEYDADNGQRPDSCQQQPKSQDIAAESDQPPRRRGQRRQLHPDHRRRHRASPLAVILVIELRF
jgi:YD repeat-containing protein